MRRSEWRNVAAADADVMRMLLPGKSSSLCRCCWRYEEIIALFQRDWVANLHMLLPFTTRSTILPFNERKIMRDCVGEISRFNEINRSTN